MLPEEQEDVIAESSTAEQEGVNNQGETPPTEETQAPESDTSAPEVKEELHKDNRPIENVAWETKRKFDEIVPTLRNEIAELKTYIQGTIKPQQPTYSKAQLQAYASEPTTTTEQRLWAYTEVDKLEREDRKSEYERLVRQTQEQSDTVMKRTQADTWVGTNFPEVVIKDQSGRPIGWNRDHPLMVAATVYWNRSKTLREDPEGFMAAVKMAAFDMGVSMDGNKKISKTIGQLRKEQKKQLASAGGTHPTLNPETASKTRLGKLQEEYARTGNKDVFTEIVKMKHLNPFV